DGSTVDREIPGVIFLAAMNVPIEGGGVPMAPHASCHDGFLTACSAFGFNRLNGLGALVKILTKRHEKKKGFLVEDFQELEIHSKKPMVIHTDGEYAGDHMQVTFRVLPKILRML
ncbi:MAG: diacylglycerol kinase family lipid kinase, partial [Lachnospiraceae bacterium]|nr:diacylglycerol kinase family lipid kinase [Lachnospiraceae bacterium]